MRKKTENIFFLCMIIALFLVGFLSIIKPGKLTSASENRKLATFESFDVGKFMDGSFQDNFESALSDQFILSEKIRTVYRRIIGSLPTIDISNAICNGRYVELFGSVDYSRATFNCDEWIVFYPKILNDNEKDILKNNIKDYDKINKLVDTYYYFINDSFVYNFETGNKAVDYVSMLKENMSEKYHLGSLELEDFSEFKENFYKTDHHWNYKGSYRGYTEIAKLMGIKDPLVPTSAGTNHEIFFGSHARTTNNLNYKEEFYFYNFDIPKHDVYIDGEPGEYGHYEDYVSHNYVYNEKENYYGYFYGNDYGEVVFDFNQPEKGNLLILSNSYSNAINKLIASHFNKTYIIDLRHYSDVFGVDFSVKEYIEKNNIDKTLFIISPSFIGNYGNNKGLES